ncbi:MAG: cell division protein FtsH, partial [Candidatus Latescibacteria bacterium]|nr:cell division protein FtsH [Candidatus Latescibacterota bacterium]
KNLVIAAEARAEKLLKENLDQVHLLAESLLEFETLDDVQIDQLLEGKELEKPEQNGRAKPPKDQTPDNQSPETEKQHPSND